MLSSNRVSLVAQMVKNLPAIQETRVQSLGGEDPVKKGMATHSSILAWRIPWTEKPGWGHSPWGHKESDTTEVINTSSNRRLERKCVEKQDEHTVIMTESER